jgi:hypothetical protein
MISVRFLACLALASPGALSTAANACIPPAPLVPLPAETATLFQARSINYHQALNDEERRAFQIGLSERSQSYFLGVVTASQALDLQDGVKGRMVSVRPLKNLRGALPDTRFTLRDRGLTSCGLFGGGSATRAVAGEYVIVFRAVAFSGLQGTADYGLRAQDARAPYLLAALNEFALEQRDSARKTP